MSNRLDREYTGISLFKFTVPYILNLLFMSVYQMVDALFIANYAGEIALAAMNIVYPPISVLYAIALMFSTGGSAVVAGDMGRGKDRRAREYFTMIILAGLLTIIVFTIVCVIYMDELLTFLGATELLRQDSIDYLGVLIYFLPLAGLQTLFQSFLIAAGRPGIGFLLTLLSGLTNVILDYVFVAKMGAGIQGAALATAIGYCVGAVPGFFCFISGKSSTLCFVKPKFRPKTLLFVCFNGSSEMVANLSISVTTLFFNRLSLEYMGEQGVAAITVALYAQFFLIAVFIGYIGGAAPIISFNFGSNDSRRLNSLFKNSFITMLIMTGISTAAAYLLAEPIVSVFISRDSGAFQLAYRGFLLFSVSYLFAGFNIYASGLFTALQNGKVSGIISFMHTFALLVGALVFLPRILGADGIWLAVPVAEFLCCFISAAYLIRYKYRYHFVLR